MSVCFGYLSTHKHLRLELTFTFELWLLHCGSISEKTISTDEPISIRRKIAMQHHMRKSVVNSSEKLSVNLHSVAYKTGVMPAIVSIVCFCDYIWQSLFVIGNVLDAAGCSLSRVWP